MTIGKAVCSSKAQMHPVFVTRVVEIAEQAQKVAEAQQQTGGYEWMLPDGLGDPTQHAQVTEKFDRMSIGENYQKCIASGQDPGTIGDVVSLKMQGDYIAAMERGFRVRWASPIRCLAHAMARRKGHGHDKGIFKDGVIGFAQDAIKAGQGG